MKPRLILCLSLALAGCYCVLAYSFMWPPVVREYDLHHRPTSSAAPCVNNLRRIEAGINEWARVNDKHAGDPVKLEQIKPYCLLNSQGELPSCPYGGKYSVTVVGAEPTCSFGKNPQFTRVRVGYFYWEYVHGFAHRLE